MKGKIVLARRSDHTREELAALVRQAAHAIVEREGWEAVTMRRIAAAIGYAPGSIYNAVGDIDAVLLDVNTGTFEQLANQLETVISKVSEHSSATRAIEVAVSYIAFVNANAAAWAAVVAKRATAMKGRPEAYASALTRCLDAVGLALQALYPDADLRARAGLELWAALQGIASMTVDGWIDVGGTRAASLNVASSLVARYLSGCD